MPLNAINLYVDFIMTFRHVHCFGEVIKKCIEARQPKYETSSFIISLIESLVAKVNSIIYLYELRKCQHHSSSTAVYFTNIVMPLQYPRLSVSFQSGLPDSPQMGSGNTILNIPNLASLSQSSVSLSVMPQYVASKYLPLVSDTKSTNELDLDKFAKERVADKLIQEATSVNIPPNAAKLFDKKMSKDEFEIEIHKAERNVSEAISANTCWSDHSSMSRMTDSGYNFFDEFMLNDFKADLT